MVENPIEPIELPDPIELIEPKRPRASQDQRLANRINQYRTALTSALANPELLGRLRERSYDEVELNVGLTLCDAAQVTFNARQNALAAVRAFSVSEQAARKAAREGFMDFRKTVRAVFVDEAALTALGAKERVPGDQEKFITWATAAYAAVLGNSAYLTTLTNYGFDQSATEAEQAKLAVLVQASAAHETAKAVAVHATAERNAAARAMDSWWKQFRAIASVTLKDRPDLKLELGL